MNWVFTVLKSNQFIFLGHPPPSALCSAYCTTNALLVFAIWKRDKISKPTKTNSLNLCVQIDGWIFFLREARVCENACRWKEKKNGLKSSVFKVRRALEFWVFCAIRLEILSKSQKSPIILWYKKQGKGETDIDAVLYLNKSTFLKAATAR